MKKIKYKLKDQYQWLEKYLYFVEGNSENEINGKKINPSDRRVSKRGNLLSTEDFNELLEIKE